MESNVLRELKQAFFAHRNGIVADALRQAGDPHEYIMGCLLADVSRIVNTYSPSPELADALWEQRGHRECRLAAPLLHPMDMNVEKARIWCADVQSTEEADVLCHRLLRHLSFACSMWNELVDSEEVLTKYTGYRLLLNLLQSGRLAKTVQLRDTIAETRPYPDGAIRPLINRILEEFDE